MAKKRDYYEVLGVSKQADDAELKKAYRAQAMKYHPDKNPGDKVAEDKFKEVAEAYDVLSNADKRAVYDRQGHQGVENMGGNGGFRGGSADDIFAQFEQAFRQGGGGSPFEEFFGGGGGRSRRPQGQPGSNLRIKVKLTMEEILTGVSKTLKLKKQVTCENCKGSGAREASDVDTCSTCRGAGYVTQMRSTFLGQMQTTVPCPKCQGSGKTVRNPCGVCRGEGRTYGEDTVTVNIPPGVSEGIQLSMSGAGNAGAKGGPAGDLHIIIEEEPHEHLTREGVNVIYELYINMADAALGTKVDVPGIETELKVTIPPGTQSGKLFRVKGKGLPELQNPRLRGDQLIHVNVWTPKKLSDEERRLLEKLRTMPNFNPTPGKGDKGFFEQVKDFFQ